MSHSSATHRPLERAPGNRDNWVEKSGGLPRYIERIAKHIRSDSGLSTSRAIASAISQVKKWARGGDDVSAATRAKAAKAVAQWSALKAKNKSRQATNLSVARLEGRVLDLAELVDLAAVNGRHVPGTPYNWKHGYIPLNAHTAAAHGKGFWETPNGKRKSVADARKKLGVKSNAELKKKLAENPDALNSRGGGKKPAADSPKAGAQPKAKDKGSDRLEVVPAEGNPRHRVEADKAGNARVRDTQRNRTTGTMGRAEADRLAAAQNDAQPRTTPKQPKRQEPDEDGWVAVPKDQQRLKAPTPQPETVVGTKATSSRPHQVVKRNGKFHVRDTRRNRLSPAMAKYEARVQADFENERETAPVEEVMRGAGVQRAGRNDWRVIDSDGSSTPLIAPTKEQAREKVRAMWEVRDLTDTAGDADQSGESLQAKVDRRVNSARVDAAGRPSEGERIYQAARSEQRRRANLGDAAKPGRARATQTAGGAESAPAAAAAPQQQRARPSGLDQGTTAQPAAGKQDDALFGLTSEQKSGQVERMGDILAEFTKGSPDAAARKLLRGEKLRREEHGRVMELQRDPNGNGWNYTYEPNSDDEKSGRNATLSDAVEGIREAYSDDIEEELAVPKANQERVNAAAEKARAAQPKPPQRSDAQRRRAAVARMSRKDQDAHIQNLEREARAAKGGTRSGSGDPAKAQRLMREANESRNVAAGLVDVESGRKIDPRTGEIAQPKKTRTKAAAPARSSEAAATPPQQRSEPAAAGPPPTPEQSARTPLGRDFDDKRTIAQVARDESERIRKREEEARNSALPSLRTKLAEAQAAEEKYRKRHSIAAQRSPKVQERLTDLQRDVRNARANLARTENREAPGSRTPTQAEMNRAEREATEAGKKFRARQDKIRRSGGEMTQQQRRELARLYDTAVTAQKTLQGLQDEKGDAEMQKAREDARAPYRVKVGNRYTSYKTRDDAEAAASRTGGRGVLAQVTTPDGEELSTYNRNEKPERAPISEAQANRAYADEVRANIGEATDVDALEEAANRFEGWAAGDNTTEDERKTYTQLAQQARERVPQARQENEQAERNREQYRQRRKDLEERANTAYRAGDLEEAERATGEMLELTRNHPGANPRDTSVAMRTLDRLQGERAAAQPAEAPTTDADRIAQAQEALSATDEEIAKVRQKAQASIDRNGTGNVSARVQANRDKLQARFEELRTQRQQQQRALVEARFPDDKRGSPTLQEAPTRSSGQRVVEAHYDDGRSYSVEYDDAGVSVSREGVRVRVGRREADPDMNATDYANRLGATVDRILNSTSSRSTDRFGRPVLGFATREDATAALARMDTVTTYVARDPHTGEWTVSKGPPDQGRAFVSQPGGGWHLAGPGVPRYEVRGETLTPDMLRMLSESTQAVDVSHEQMRTGRFDTAELTGERRIEQGQMQVQARIRRGASEGGDRMVWLPISVVDDQIRGDER